MDLKGETPEQRMGNAKQLMRECFRIIYRYVLVVRECGRAFDVEDELARELEHIFVGFNKHLFEWDGDRCVVQC
jgi:hypothetical protein